MSHGGLKTKSAVEGAVMDGGKVKARDRSCVLPPPALRLFDPWGIPLVTASEPGIAHHENRTPSVSELWYGEASSLVDRAQVPWKGALERVRAPSCPDPVAPRDTVGESGFLGMQPQSDGKFHPRLNTGERPIANKYREGKMKGI
ncbi:hypothetical protein Lal_00012439 [Lupinus albus]|nr:hypothetical protein Lal_00012439 [Lupinus albus]